MPDSIEQAIGTYVISRMSRCGQGKAFSWQERLRGGQPGSLNEWMTSLDNLILIRDRLKNVEIHNEDALLLLKRYKSPSYFFYLDPPYLTSTRTKNLYDYEMTEQDHIDLLDVITKSQAKILISGYSSDLYNDTLRFWGTSSKHVANNSGQNAQKQKRTERLWWNY